MKTIEYALFRRKADDHSPDSWLQVGKVTEDPFLLRDIAHISGAPVGVTWIVDDFAFKIMQRSVTISEWQNEREELVKHSTMKWGKK